MKELSAQIIDHGKRILVPMSMEDDEKLLDYHVNQIVKVKVYGVKKPRSVRQMNTYWACCAEVALNTDDPKWNDKKKVDFNCRVGCGFKDENYLAMTPEGYPQFKYLSISFASLGHAMACGYFEKAFDHMATFLGVTVDELVAAAKGRMQKR